MLGLLVTFAFAMFAHDNAEFINDMNDKLEQDCTFTYVGKQEVRLMSHTLLWTTSTFTSAWNPARKESRHEAGIEHHAL